MSTSSPVALLLASVLRPSLFCRVCQGQKIQARGISQAWKQRQAGDAYAREARVKGLKSRAAFKLLEVRRCGLGVDLGMSADGFCG